MTDWPGTIVQPAGDGGWPGEVVQPTAPERPGLLRRGWNAARDLVTGDNRREFDLPELADAPEMNSLGALGTSAFWKNFGATFVAQPEAAAQIAARSFPGAQAGKDRFGNPIVTMQDGRRYYINRPGLSQEDISSGLANALAFGPASALGTMGGLTGAVLTGLASAGTSIAQDAATQALGGNQDADLGRAAIAGGAAAGATFAAPMLDRAANWLARTVRGRSSLITPQGTLTPAGQQAARQAGLDPAQMSAEMSRAFADQVQRAANPAHAAATAQAGSLPVPVRMTQGQVTGAPGQQMFENLAEKGAYGDAASTYMRGVRGDQQQQLAANIPAIQGRIAGGAPTVTAPGQASQAAQARLGTMAAAERAGVDAAYDAARDTASSVASQHVQGRLQPILDDVRRNHALTGLGRTSAILDDLVSTATSNNGIVPVRALFDWRQRATAARAAGGEEAVAIGRAIRGVDGMLDDIAANALLQGDDTAIEAFRTAIRTNREFAARFKAGDVIEQLVAREPRGGVVQLAVPPEQAANVIFGASRMFGGGNTARDLLRLRDVLGAGSQEWRSLREEAWLRLARSAQGPINPLTGEAQVSGANFARAFNTAMQDNMPVLQAMFSREEMALMRQFRDVATRATMAVRGGDNYSNTAVGLSNIVQRLAGTFLTSESAAARFMAIPLVRQIYSMGAGLAAPAAIAPRLAPPASVGTAGRYLAAPAATGAAADERRE